MASTFAQIFQRLQEQRDATSEKSPVADSLNRLADAMSVMHRGITSLDESIKEQRIAQGAARNLAQADDVKEQIRTLLELKVSEDTIERERHQRMMDVAESVIPQITDEQLDAIREQRKAYREQQWALKEELRIAEETAKVQKENSQAIADAEKFAITDKYDTISSVVSGLESKAQDPLSKMLVQGLGRFVKGKEDDKAKVVAQTQADRDRIIDRDLAWKKEDIQEDAAIDAYRKGIKDPGSAVALLKQRDQQVAALAKVGESVEAGIVSGNYRRQNSNKGKQRSREERANAEIADASPAVKQAISGEWIPVAQTKEEPQPRPAPENAHFKKSDTQTTELVTPKKSSAKNPVSTGAFGSKAGAVDMGGIGKAISSSLGRALAGIVKTVPKLLTGIVTKLGSMAGSFLKFLGPWGIVASALLSFDRLVPIFSSLTGAIMDITKLIMPLVITTLVEGFAQILGGINGLISLFDRSWFGRGWYEDSEVQSKLETERAKVTAEQEERAKMKKDNADPNSTAIDTTTGSVISVSPVRNEAALTPPAEADRIYNHSVNANRVVSDASTQEAIWMKQQQEQNQSFRESLMTVAKTPGTTPMWNINPSLAPWFA